MSTLLELDKVSIAYGRRHVVHEVSFQLEEGMIGCLLGPSGCGKTTLLRAIAGFEPVASGWIYLASEVVSRAGYALPPEKRQVGMVFQDFALFPHLTVEENIAFGIRQQSVGERKDRVTQLLQLVGLPAYGKAYPHQLSGGQQQRIALARALAPRPKLLLMDEPFSSMDVELREGLAREVRAILKQEGISGLLVTHDQFEAFAMADEIGVINAGELQQWANGYQLYHQPANRFVADFIGQGVLLPGTVLNPHQVETELGIIEGEVPAFCGKGCQVDILVRPDDIVHDDNADLPAEVLDKAFRGAQFLYTLRLQSGVKVLSLAHSHYDYEVGARMKIRLDIDHLVMFPRREDVRP
ncbi:MAG: ABC transporter ATP-binding protein [Chromatiales bacterium]|nr:ABC transporter ATP-binding protein [Chromatiales bacterium]